MSQGFAFPFVTLYDRAGNPVAVGVADGEHRLVVQDTECRRLLELLLLEIQELRADLVREGRTS